MNDSSVIRQQTADDNDPIYRALLAQVEKDGGKVVNLGAATATGEDPDQIGVRVDLQQADEVEGTVVDAYRREGREVVGRVLVDLVLSEVNDEGERELDLVVYPSVREDHLETIPMDAAVGMAKAALIKWELEEKRKHGRDEDRALISAAPGPFGPAADEAKAEHWTDKGPHFQGIVHVNCGPDKD